MSNAIYDEKNLFSTRTAPWMKLGKLVEATQSSAEAAKLAGLDFEVEKRPAGWQDAAGNWHTIKDQYANVRQDTQAPLGFVGRDYSLLQNGAAFDFMDGVGNCQYIAAGALKGGKQAFMVAQPNLIVAPGGDPIEMFVTLRTSHDRTRAVEVQLTPLRGMCMNQLYSRSFTRGAEHRWSIPHNRSMEAKMHQAAVVLAQLGAYSDGFVAMAEALMAAKVTVDQAHRIVNAAMPEQMGGRERPANVERIVNLHLHDTDTVGFNGTGWSLVNAVSDYMDHGRRAGTPESRFRSALNGQTFRMVNSTIELVLAA